MGPLPLAGLTVVAVEQAVAAPLASRQLADLGARVIKIEPPGRGDLARSYDHAFGDVSSYFGWLNRGKESVCLDLRDPADVQVLDELIGRGDVLVHNVAPRTAQRLGLTAASVVERFPRLVACEISGYAPGSARSEQLAYDLLIQAEVGLADLTGTADGPARVGISIADIAAGMYAFGGIMSALYAVRETGLGQALSVSLFDALTEWMSAPAFYAWQTGHVPRRLGLRHATIAPYGAFDTRDGTVVLGVQTEQQWQRLCRDVLAAPELADDARFESNVARVAHRDLLDAEIQKRIGTMERDVIDARLHAAGVPCSAYGTVMDLRRTLRDEPGEQLRSVDGPSGQVWALQHPVRFGAFDPAAGPVPALGQHTDAVLAELPRHPIPDM